MARALAMTCCVTAVAAWARLAVAQAVVETPPEHFEDPLVVTPAGQPSRVSESPSTTFVITADEIRRGGATSIPEILRRVPGLDVRLITATDGELGLRGFAYEITDRVLVLVDGRTVYIDFFGGTAYEMLPISLVDIERIEVVLGPGASVYGNKAMLGTINIITRSGSDYPVAEARVDAGPPGDGRIGVRYGTIRGAWRLRATALGRRLTPHARPPPWNQGGTDTSAVSAGGGTLSAAYSPSPETEASIEVGGMSGGIDLIPTGAHVDRFEGTTGYVRAQGRLALGGPGSPYGDLHLDLVWNAGAIRSATFPPPTSHWAGGFHAAYSTPYARLHHELHSTLFDLPLHGRWGGEVRFNTLDSEIVGGERQVWNVAAFGSGELSLGRWRLTAGLRVDRSTLTRTGFSPRLSAVWSPVEGHQLRATFNTGYNDPHLFEYHQTIWLGPPGSEAHLVGNPDLAAEHLLYGELGWTGRLTGSLRGFASAFAYRFSDWLSLAPPSQPPDVWFVNNAPTVTYGGEAGLEVSFRRRLFAYAAYALILPQGRADAGYYGTYPHFSPRHKVTAGFRIEHPTGAYLTADAQYFGSSTVARPDPDTLQAGGCADPSSVLFCRERFAAFVTAQARLGYEFRNGVDVSVAVSNAFDDRTVQIPGGEAPERRFMATVASYR